MSNAVVRIDPASRESWPPEFDKGPHPRAQIGQIGYVLVANVDLSEAGFFGLKPPGVGVHFTRVPMPREVDVTTLTATEWDLAGAAASMMPGCDDLDVISYSGDRSNLLSSQDTIRATCSRAKRSPPRRNGGMHGPDVCDTPQGTCTRGKHIPSYSHRPN